MNGLKYITDEKGNQTGILLDLTVFRKENIKAVDVLNSLEDLQQLIDNAGNDQRVTSDWERAKDKLKHFKG